MKPIGQSASTIFTQTELQRILTLYAKNHSLPDIAKALRHSSNHINLITSGHIPIPSSLHPFIHSLGLRLCSACHFRLVPIHPIRAGGRHGPRGVCLLRLCYLCWTGKTGLIPDLEEHQIPDRGLSQILNL